MAGGAAIATDTDTTALVPDAPVQLKEYVAGAVSAPVDWLPFAASVPLHAPEAVQAVALVEVQVRVAAPPLATAGELTVRAATGGGVAAGVTVTVAKAASLVPPAPVQVIEKVVVAASAPVVRDPLAASDPLQPPAATHASASTEVHVSVAAPSLTTMAGAAVSVAVGLALGVDGCAAVACVASAVGPTDLPQADSARTAKKTTQWTIARP
jgi:hypothetical protein